MPDITVAFGSNAVTMHFGKDLDAETGEWLPHVNALCPVCGEWDGPDLICPCWGQARAAANDLGDDDA